MHIITSVTSHSWTLFRYVLVAVQHIRFRTAYQSSGIATRLLLILHLKKISRMRQMLLVYKDILMQFCTARVIDLFQAIFMDLRSTMLRQLIIAGIVRSKFHWSFLFSLKKKSFRCDLALTLPKCIGGGFLIGSRPISASVQHDELSRFEEPFHRGRC